MGKEQGKKLKMPRKSRPGQEKWAKSREKSGKCPRRAVRDKKNGQRAGKRAENAQEEPSETRRMGKEQGKKLKMPTKSRPGQEEWAKSRGKERSEEHTSELQSR